MRLSLQTDYALRTLMYLASVPGRATIQQVADLFRISVDHVAKVVQHLNRLGYIRSVRGVGGGIELGDELVLDILSDTFIRMPDQRTLGVVVGGVELRHEAPAPQ